MFRNDTKNETDFTFIYHANLSRFFFSNFVTKERVTKNYNVRGFCNVSEVTAVCAFYT